MSTNLPRASSTFLPRRQTGDSVLGLESARSHPRWGPSAGARPGPVYSNGCRDSVRNPADSLTTVALTSKRTNELPAAVVTALRAHLATFPVRPEEIKDDTDPRTVIVRPAHLLFTRGDGRPIHRADWSYIWRPAVQAAGLPPGYGLRDLRHYFATVLKIGGANVKTVQFAMGHTTPTVTLNTYVGYWPDAVDQTRTPVDTALGCTGAVPAGVA